MQNKPMKWYVVVVATSLRNNTDQNPYPFLLEFSWCLTRAKSKHAALNLVKNNEKISNLYISKSLSYEFTVYNFEGIIRVIELGSDTPYSGMLIDSFCYELRNEDDLAKICSCYSSIPILMLSKSEIRNYKRKLQFSNFEKSVELDKWFCVHILNKVNSSPMTILENIILVSANSFEEAENHIIKSYENLSIPTIGVRETVIANFEPYIDFSELTYCWYEIFTPGDLSLLLLNKSSELWYW